MAMLVKVCLVILPDGYLQRALMSDIQFFSPGGYHRQFRQFYPDQNLAGAQLCLNNVQIVFFCHSYLIKLPQLVLKHLRT